MKAPSPARQLYDGVQAAPADAAAGLIAAASPELQRALAAYTQRRAQLVGEHVEYAQDVQDREEWEAWCNRDPKTRWGALKRHYRNGNVALMIDDWGWTLNPKRANTGGSVRIPFRLWPRQFEMVEWMWKHYRESSPGVCAKAREVGASWLAMAFSACICVLFKNVVVGVVASTEDKLDSNKDPSPTLPKAREFLMGVPEPLRAGFDNSVATAPYLKCITPETGSLIRGWTGSGDQGRGARAAMVVIDEAAFFQDEAALDASLSAVSDCLMYFSSANGTAGGFFEKASSGAFDTFWFRINDDPRKTPEWCAAKKRVTDPVVWASEYEINFTASIDHQLFEWKWVEAAIGLLPLLESRDGFKNPDVLRAALDVSDQGKDKNVLTVAKGVLVRNLYMWSGAGATQHDTCAHAFSILDEHGGAELIYDASVAGAGISGAAQVLNERRDRRIALRDFVGGSTRFPNPQALARGTDRKCEDFFQNLKAFAYWNLRQRFIESWKARNGEAYDAEFVICLDPELPQLALLQNELAQIQRKMSAMGDKLVIDKAPERAGKPRAKSPNCADSLSMLMGCAIPAALAFSDELLQMLSIPESDRTLSYTRGY
nr:MAG TPA: large terminase [Caudoviricetes sp.]